MAVALSSAFACQALMACGGEKILVKEEDIRVRALIRYEVRSCEPRGEGPTGSPWRCSVRGAGPFYDLDIYIENDGQFTYRNTKGDFLADNCCIPVDGKVTYRPPP